MVFITVSGLVNAFTAGQGFAATGHDVLHGETFGLDFNEMVSHPFVQTGGFFT